MPELVQYSVQEDIAIVTINNPPVNALSPGVPEGIDAGVARAAADTAVKAVVLIGAGSTFIAGADIKVFGTIPNRDVSIDRSHLIHALLRRIEDCPKPVVCAIHGTALGGGLEFAMACHYRVAVPGAKVGQPEVLLGIIPGAGGTQRLPRLCGVATAVEMCTLGQHIAAPRALAEGIVDQIVDGDLLAGAIAFARAKAAAGEIRKVREQETKIADYAMAAAAIEAARASLKKTARGAHAPYAAVDAIAAGVQGGFDAGSAREIELFADCVLSAESHNLIRLFFAEREAAKVPGIPKDTPTLEIRKAAVVGAGTMGGGIAMNYANAGIPVLLKETDQAALDRGLATIRKNYDTSAAKGKMTTAQVDRVMSLIRPTLTYDGFDEVDIVVEAVFENFDLKKSVFADLGRVARPDCVLASNTSTLDIDQFAQASGRPANVIGHHFFSPANVMKLMEIVRGRESSNQTIATSLKLSKKLNKVGVVVGNCFGFVANRMLAYYMREAYLLLEEGAGVPQIDQVMTGFGMPVGPFGMQDIAGIDVGARIRQYLRSIGKSRAEGPESPVPDWLCEMGRYGQKTGAGWYKYEAGSRTPIPDPLIEELAAKAAKESGIARQPVSDDEILSRIMVALANEGANVLDEHIAIRPGDIDVIYAHGFGYPRHRGGPMAYADSLGLAHVLAKVNEYRARLGDHWLAAPLLERLAAAGKGFYDAAAAASAG
ncbi:MAG TPA: 3-hydroxyacyl-CoA dehydrogenase NAD-binding domain-containing protein [Bryobacteraceae bacterium]|jgi:3-hydroxyacyl-CoA dehydrogenase|nr:3-hydroxyacyl-CoA dehydrogenase NAD-binding domain-containing protein [Bryobacteraceae bacterium]